MNQPRRWLVLGFAMAGLTGAQVDTVPASRFIAVDVRGTSPTAPSDLIGVFPPSDRYELRGATMLNFITRAWGVATDRIAGGPNWLGIDKFDFVATFPPGTNSDAMKAMLQVALAERFGLTVHSEDRPTPVFAMTVAKGGARLKKANDSDERGCRASDTTETQSEVSYAVFVCKHMTMGELADWAPGRFAGYFAGIGMVDHTGLEGAWDFTFKISTRNQLAAAGSAGITFFDAAEKQLGLKIESTKIPLPVLVVDKVNEKPTETSPEALKMLAGPTEFELVVIKPSPPDSKPEGNGGILPGGRFELHHATIQELIEIAWDIQNDDLIVGAPSFITAKLFDIVARAPANGALSNMSMASVETMMQSMLKDRFKLAAHNEERPGEVFALLPVKPKMKTADPVNRSDCKANPSPNPVRNRLIVCQNVTMAQFAVKLPGIAGGYFGGKPAFDATGLGGAFDFTLNFSGAAVWERASAAVAAGGGTSDPTGAISLQDALQQQLGLRLVTQKRPRSPVLVIDHVEENPTDN